jgi:molybdate transport system substrate-binding protein
MKAEELLVAAAADLSTAAPALQDAFTRTSGFTLKWVFGGSGALARQIEAGAPFDLYLSANERFVKDLALAGRLLPGSVSVYALGRLGLWSKAGSYRSEDDLRKPALRYLALPNPALAPYGAAAKEFLLSRKLWTQVEPKVVYAENVLQALQFAESGNADAVITAWSLVKSRGGVLLAPDAYSPLRQAGAVVRTSKQPAAGARFLAFLTGIEGRAVLENFGFGAP